MTKKLFLLRGLVRESRHWGDVLNALQNTMTDLKIITPSIQGTGEFHEMTSPNNFDDMIRFMRQKYESEFKDGQRTLLAMSLGGMIAKRWTELYPQDFSKLILVNTSFKGINPLYRRLQPQSMLEFLKIFLTFDLSSREKKIISLVSNATYRHEDVHTLWLEIQKTAPVSRKSFINQLLAALTFKPNLEKPRSQLYILAGERDRLCSVECSKKLHEVWGGEIYLHPEAGHDLPLDVPEWFVEKVHHIINS